MRNRTHYWSCSNFADWLRGNPKPSAETAEGWHAWRKESKAKHPFRYWLVEEGLDAIQSAIHWPTDKIYSLKYYINNRWVTRTHALTADPKDSPRGQWKDLGNRFLPCMFNELVNYVEIELAWWHIAWSDKDERKKYNVPFWATGWWRWRTWRCPQAGMDNLEWQCNLVWTEDQVGKDSPDCGKPTRQAIAAKEIIELYNWWTKVRPNRPDPYDASGWTEICNQKRQLEETDDVPFFATTTDPKQRKIEYAALKKLKKMEAQYEKEDEQMMIRLIKIKDSLWT